MRRITPDMPREGAQRIAREEAGDLKARWMLIDRAEVLYSQRSPECASLIHAYEYLADREGYERAPWPKGMVKLPAIPCRHGASDALGSGAEAIRAEFGSRKRRSARE